MKKQILTILFSFYAFCSLSANTNPTAQRLLVTATQQASLFNHDTSPFQLDIDFFAQMQIPGQGHLTLMWESEDRWWSRIVMGTFEQIDIRNGDRLYTTRNAPFTPVRIMELNTMLHFAEHSEGLQIKKEKQRVERGVAMNCLQGNVTRGDRHEVCVDPSRDFLGRMEMERIP